MRLRCGLFGLSWAIVQAGNPYPLDRCIEQALQANRQRAVSQANLRIAEAQLGQALSTRWPEAGLEITGTRHDQDPDFIMPASSLGLGGAAQPLAEAVAATQLAKAGITPATVGQAAYNAQLAQATQAVLGQVGNIATPATDLKLAGRDNLLASFQVHYPIYTGGKASAVIRQARAGVAAAKAEAVATDLQIVQDVRRYYYASVLGRNLLAIGQAGLERMQQVQGMAEAMLQGGSGKVKPTDVSRGRLAVANLKTLVAQLRSNEDLATMALATSMGLPWDAAVEPADVEVPVPEVTGDLAKLVAQAQSLNPQALQVGYGMAAAEAGVDSARAGHLPVVVLFGSADHLENPYHAGLTSPTNRDGWTVGIRVQVPVFSGFKVQNEIREAAARRDKLGGQQKLLEQGLGVQVKGAFLELARAEEQTRTTGEALAAARQNREAHEQAFMKAQVEAKDVLEAQLAELAAAGQYQQARYDAQCFQGQLQALVGQGLGIAR